jgi:DNA-binding winged helix-turn-helix (wHTH) protein
VAGGRRFWPENGDLLYRFADFALDTGRRELRRGPHLIAIAPRVFDLLEYLIKNRNRVVSKDDLIAAIWDGRAVSETALSTRMNAVRCAIDDTGEDQRLIRTFPRKALTFAGAHTRALEVLEANIRIDPFQPSNALGLMGLANYMLKRYREAVGWLHECASRLPNLQWPHLWLASAYAQSGQPEEARKRPRRCCGSTRLSRLKAGNA